MVNYEWNKVMGLFHKDGEFFRKGKIGDWLQHYSTTLSKEADLMIKNNLKYSGQIDYGISEENLQKIYSASEAIKSEKNKINL